VISRQSLARIDRHVERTRQATCECVRLSSLPLREELIHACSKPFNPFLELNAGTAQQLHIKGLRGSWLWGRQFYISAHQKILSRERENGLRNHDRGGGEHAHTVIEALPWTLT